VRPYQDAIQRHSKRLSVLLSSLIEFGGENPEKRRVSLADLIDLVLNLMGWQLARDGIHVEVCFEDDLPPVLCHPEQIEQVVATLVANARESLKQRWPEGGEDKQLRIAGRRGKLGGSPCAEIEVWDAGAGLAPSQLERLFEPLGEGGFGEGIGLAACREVLREHDGSIRVKSELGVYTRVVISLPLEEEP
jgi:signal transduction histidine kinase